MNVLVTGGAGYIGSHVVHELLSSGYTPVIYDNLYSGQRMNVPKNVKLIVGDVTDMTQMLDALTGIDSVIHLAALKAAGESMIHPELYAEKNISGTITLLNAMRKKNVKYIILSSTAAVYGEPKQLPVTEETPTIPENFYGYSKLKMEELCDWYSKLGNIRYSSLRYFNVAGYDIKGQVRGLEQNPNNLFPIIMEVLKGLRKKLYIYVTDYATPDGTAIRDYIQMNDLVNAHVLALKYIVEEDKNLTVNLGTSVGLSVKDVISKTEEITGITINKEYTKRRAGDTDQLICDYSLAKKILNWEPALSDITTIIQTMLDVYNIPCQDSQNVKPLTG